MAISLFSILWIVTFLWVLTVNLVWSLELLCPELIAKYHLTQESQYLLITNTYLLNPNSIQDIFFEAKGSSQSNEEQPKQLY